ncbi:M1 family metallopeptidase [Winogradskyella sp.]|uniref:M1 family metallopeptidase n=1 Tax=Winogradskyella sp. TaxID=1883156 RepID=UPI0035C86AF3
MKKLLIVLLAFVSTFSICQNGRNLDVKTANIYIWVNPDINEIRGSVVYKFDVIKKDTLVIDKRNIQFDYFRFNKDEWIVDTDKFKGNKVEFFQNKSLDNEIEIKFTAKPKKALYFVKRNENWNIWTQGQGKYTSNWLPSFDDVNEKVEFDITITFDEDYRVLANGKLDSITSSKGYKTWHYDMQKPMSSYLVALAIGKYDKKIETSESGIPIELYYYPEDSAKVEPTYRYTKQMFDFLEEEIGFGYPWQNYKQVPVHDFLYSGMENTSLTIFSDAYVVDEIGFNDKNYVNVNAHELAHQWFGDLVTATSGEHHWLQEGFATYYALLSEKEVFGKDYFDFKLYNSAQDLARQDLAGSGTSLLNPKSSSLTFYQRGAWVLYALRDKVGDKVFQNAVKNYLEKHQFGNVKTSDFISEVEVLYKKSLTDFVSNWIDAKAFPFNDAVELLKEQSVFIQEYMMVDCEANSSKCKDYLKYYISDEAKIKVIAQRPDLISNATFAEGLKVRQAISQYVTKIPTDLKDDYETLLDDKSYLTIESALYNLWINFPLERSKYLTKIRDTQGFNDKNVRLLWLVLALNTMEFQPENNNDFLKELLSYTDASQNFELRMNAFTYLDLIKACGSECQSNLEQAKTHHNWRMSKFAKDMLNQLNNPKN